MSGVAAVVLAHADPVHLHRLVEALDPLPVVLHVDLKTPDAVHEQMVAGLPDRVRLCPRRRTDLASWSLVAAELAGLAEALATTDADHIAVLSGADYPLVSVPALEAELAARPGTRLPNAALPIPDWDTPRNPDGGLWRVRTRFVTVGERVVFVRNVPLRWPGRRAVPDGVVLRGGLQWKVYQRDHAQLLVDVARRPEVVAFWRTTLVPDEVFAATVLASSALTGAPPLPVDPTSPWLVRWPTAGAYHPRWLTHDDLPGIVEECRERVAAGRPPLLFARKVSSRGDGEALVRGIDEQLRG